MIAKFDFEAGESAGAFVRRCPPNFGRQSRPQTRVKWGFVGTWVVVF